MSNATIMALDKNRHVVAYSIANEVWRNYQLYVEQFYDLLNLNREAREYDFKKNLEAKTKLCEEAEALDKVPLWSAPTATPTRSATC